MADNGEIIGVFIGLSSSSYEYIANITAPYKANFSIELGTFLLINDPPNTLVARVIDFIPQGELISFMGQKWLSDMANTPEAIGADIKKRKISYTVKIKILGSLDEKNKFNAGLRKIPHITSKVVKPDTSTVKGILDSALSEQQQGIIIGNYFLDTQIPVKFNLSEFEAKRTFIFARAGYGKSNLMKIIASDWSNQNGGLIIFDPEGEYAITDKSGRPGIMDLKGVILITNRHMPPSLKNVYTNLKVDLANLDPKFIIPIIVPETKHETVFFSKLMSLRSEQWRTLVNLLYHNGWSVSDDEIRACITGQADDEKITPMKNNLIPAIQALHDPDSYLIEIIEHGLEEGNTILLDISLLDKSNAQKLGALIIRHIFNRNQRNFIEGSIGSMIRATFVIEEAQEVLGQNNNLSSFVELAKEGRKYRLGGIFITQQPKSIPFEILSQSDNFFTFHLLSKGDLVALQNANAHYSEDVVTQILSEPVKGKTYMWTSSQPFVIPVQIENFEKKAQPRKAEDIQNKNLILDAILDKITGEQKELKSILTKLEKIEQKNPGGEKNSIVLFNDLSQDEKDLLDAKGYLQKNKDTNLPWAVTYPGYRKLKNRNIKTLLEET
ncbi:MAG: DUF87 domain-containing protein [Candidatus Micrarchaeia archaeon]